MKLKKIIAYWLTDLPYFLRLPIDRKRRLLVLFAFFRITVIHIILVRLLRIPRNHEHFLGIYVEAFDHETIFFLFAEIFYRGEYAFVATTSNPRILDCGANIGFATMFFKWIYPNAIIDSFEPDPLTFAKLERNVKRNKFQNVELHNSALSDVNGETTFYVDDNHPGSLRMSSNADRHASKPITVATETLEKYLKENSIDFLKLDVEGAENEILRYLDTHALFSGIHQLAIEYHHHVGDAHSCLAEFLAIFEKHGFSYQISARAIPICEGDQFQDINIFCYRKK